MFSFSFLLVWQCTVRRKPIINWCCQKVNYCTTKCQLIHWETPNRNLSTMKKFSQILIYSLYYRRKCFNFVMKYKENRLDQLLAISMQGSVLHLFLKYDNKKTGSFTATANWNIKRKKLLVKSFLKKKRLQYLLVVSGHLILSL